MLTELTPAEIDILVDKVQTDIIDLERWIDYLGKRANFKQKAQRLTEDVIQLKIIENKLIS